MYAQNVSTKICNFLSVCFCFFFHQKCANPGPSLIYVRSFLTNNTFKFYKKCENYPSSIWSWDSNSRHLEYECSPVTTRPGYLSLLPFFFSFLLSLSPSFYATAFFLFHSLPLILCSNVFFSHSFCHFHSMRNHHSVSLYFSLDICLLRNNLYLVYHLFYGPFITSFSSLQYRKQLIVNICDNKSILSLISNTGSLGT